MPLDAKLRQRMERELRVADEHGTAGPRLRDDAARLWKRIQRLTAMNLVGEGLDVDALELASLAIQLPLRRAKRLPTGRPGRTTLRDRAEEAAERLIEAAAGEADEMLLDRATRVLQEMPHRSPMLDEAKLLADAVNLEDFGVIGLTQLTIQLGRHGDGVLQLADGLEKREQYKYWEARLKDGFHFGPVRDLARRRLESARHVAGLLGEELKEDGAVSEP